MVEPVYDRANHRKWEALDWDDVGRESLRAAQEMKEVGCWRSSVSRSYCAAFSVLTKRLLTHAALPANFTAPSHRQMPNLIERHLTSLEDWQRRWLRTMVVRLYKERLAADYNPAQTIDAQTALDALRGAKLVFKLLRVKP